MGSPKVRDMYIIFQLFDPPFFTSSQQAPSSIQMVNERSGILANKTCMCLHKSSRNVFP